MSFLSSLHSRSARTSIARWALTMSVVALGSIPVRGAIITTPTMDSGALENALDAHGLNVESISISNGVAGQFGTYSNFNLPPVTIRNGIVLSTGNVANLGPFAKPPGYSDPTSNSDPNVSAPPPQVNNPMDPNGLGGTPEFDAYGLSSITPGTTRIENFVDSHDVAVLRIDFTLDNPSPVKFDFIFGSVEYPYWTSQFTDAFLVFLDGKTPADQITFDAAGNPVQVGNSFAGLETTGDLNTAFSSPHALIHHLTTTTAMLSDGLHTLWFEIGDVNDQVLDSAVFIANFRAEEGQEGTEPTDDDLFVPEPASLSIMAIGSLLMLRRRRRDD